MNFELGASTNDPAAAPALSACLAHVTKEVKKPAFSPLLNKIQNSGRSFNPSDPDFRLPPHPTLLRPRQGGKEID